MGFLDRFKRATPEPKDDTNINFAFVLLSQLQSPKVEDINRAFASIAPDRRALKLIESGETRDGDEILQLDAGGDSAVIVMSLPIPVPNREADEAVRFSFSSFGKNWTLPPHEAHLIATLQSSTPQLESLLLFTPILAAIAEATSAVGIYWGNAGATHDPRFFIDLAREGTVESEVALWNGVSIAKQPDGRFGLLSLGMKQLDLPDLLLIAPKDSNPVEWFFDLLGYIAERGEPLPDGDTIGRTADEKFAIRYVPSPIDSSTEVCCIEIP